MVSEPVTSSSGGGVVSHDIRMVDLFLFHVPGGSSHKTTVGIMGDYATSSTTMGVGSLGRPGFPLMYQQNP